jgi:hypothetical protein
MMMSVGDRRRGERGRARKKGRRGRRREERGLSLEKLGEEERARAESQDGLSAIEVIKGRRAR